MEKGYPPQSNAPPYPTSDAPTAGMYPEINIPPAQQSSMPMPMPHQQPPPAYEATMQQGYHSYQPVYTQQPQVVQTIVVIPNLGPEPAAVTCPSCQKYNVTRVDYETTTKTHLFAAVLCLVGLWPCFWIPYVVDPCKKGNHYCSNCGAFIGSRKGGSC